MSPELPRDVYRQVEEGISVLRRGGIVAYPTDTVYGLGASVTDREAVRKIFRAKGRPEDIALPVLLADISQLGEVAVCVPEAALKLARRFWPGGLTLVVRRAASVPDEVTAGGETVAVRVPAHPVPLALITGLGQPIVGTSANLSGRPAALTAAEAHEQLGDRVDLVIDGGPAPGGTESTVVDVTGQPPVVLRQGAVSLEALREVIPEMILKGD